MLRSLYLQTLFLLWSLMAQQHPAQADECSDHCNLAHGSCDQHRKCRCDPGWEGQYCERCVRMPGCVHGSCINPGNVCVTVDGLESSVIKTCGSDSYSLSMDDPKTFHLPCPTSLLLYFIFSLDETRQTEGFGVSHGQRIGIAATILFKKKNSLRREEDASLLLMSDIHICEHSNPCQNAATCVDDPDGEYTCLCPEGFYGRDCELKLGVCETAGSYCKNGGICQDDHGYASNYTCKCLAGFVGDLCETDVDDCLLRPCANGATCHDGINRFSCECPLGFKGRFCTINMDDCVSNPCKNNGKCYDRTNDFGCFCANGFTGKTCETLIPKPTFDTLHKPFARFHKDFSEGRSMTSGYPKATQTQPIRTVDAQRWSSHSSKLPSSGLLKISVKEVVTQKEARLTEPQLVTVIILGVLTAMLVLVTVALVLRNRWRRHHRLTWGRSSPSTRRKGKAKECEVHMLNTATSELRKTTKV